MSFKVGDKVKPNLVNWQKSEFDYYIKPNDLPIGEVIEDEDEDGFVDVCWPGGRYYQDIDEIEKVDE